MFQLLQSERIDLSEIANDRLVKLLTYWQARRRQRPMPALADLRPRALKENLGRMHVLQVLAPGQFRFLLYGGAVTNPDARDMTGLTTDDYVDREFGRMVTADMQEAVDAAEPVCRHVTGLADGLPYEYIRLTLPLATSARKVDALLVGTQRINVPKSLWRPETAPREAAALREQAERCQRLSRTISDEKAARALTGLASAFEWRAAELER